ncbi:hypothetical protein Gotri_001202 [Gossypium trilobum]|uniref:Phytocyanin domain-containing protein n=1 Tax=Gossypium trilobum TaxID=34281 RepID=A0A7J9FE25_9ROSI|nr:hypothetical protein [Gossypium trilobum]
MSSFSLQNLFKFALFSVVFISMATLAIASFQFRVGGEGGWTKPTGNEPETYNEWASRNRFHVGDSLYFRYSNDSVLVVNHTSYTNCSVSNPILKFKDGDTVFEFDSSPQPAQSPMEDGGSNDEGDGWDSIWGPPPHNSTIKQAVASYFMTALGGMLVIMYLLM